MEQEKVRFLGLKPSGKKVDASKQAFVNGFGKKSIFGRWLSGPDYSPKEKYKKSQSKS